MPLAAERDSPCLALPHLLLRTIPIYVIRQRWILSSAAFSLALSLNTASPLCCLRLPVAETVGAAVPYLKIFRKHYGILKTEIYLHT